MREARHRHHCGAQKSTAEPSTRDGTHWRQRSKRTRVIAIGLADGRGDQRRCQLTQPGGLVWIGPEQLGCRAISRYHFLDDLRQRFGTGKKVQPYLVGAHARLSVHVLGIRTHAMGEHRTNGDSGMQISLLRAIWHLDRHPAHV